MMLIIKETDSGLVQNCNLMTLGKWADGKQDAGARESNFICPVNHHNFCGLKLQFNVSHISVN